MNGIFTGRVQRSVVLTASATKSNDYALGDMVYCDDKGVKGLFVYSRNVSGGAFARGDALTIRDFTPATYEQDANVYSTSPGGGYAASIKGNTDAVAATVAKDAMAGKLLAITEGATQTDIGEINRIKGNEAATAATDKLLLYLARQFDTAPVAADDYLIYPVSECIKASAKGHIIAGICPTVVADTYYFWRQVEGLCFAKILLGAVYGVDGTSDGLSLALMGSTTAGVLDVRDADGDDMDDAPSTPGYLIHKKGASANDLGLVVLNGGAMKWL